MLKPCNKTDRPGLVPRLIFSGLTKFLAKSSSCGGRPSNVSGPATWLPVVMEMVPVGLPLAENSTEMGRSPRAHLHIRCRPASEIQGQCIPPLRWESARNRAPRKASWTSPDASPVGQLPRGTCQGNWFCTCTVERLHMSDVRGYGIFACTYVRHGSTRGMLQAGHLASCIGMFMQ
jgi:hypothetical protein